MKSFVVLALLGCLCVLVITVSSRSVTHEMEAKRFVRSDSDGDGTTATLPVSDSTSETGEDDNGAEDSDASMNSGSAASQASEDSASLGDLEDNGGATIEPTFVILVTTDPDKDGRK